VRSGGREGLSVSLFAELKRRKVLKVAAASCQQVTLFLHEVRVALAPSSVRD